MKTAPKQTLEPGGVVFFPACKKTPKPNSQTLVFQGHGFGIFLGIVPTGMEMPSRAQMDPLLSAVGWVSFENVAEMLGEDQFEILATKFREKYGLEEVPEGEEMSDAPAPRATPEIALPEERKLIGLDGKPLGKPVDA